MIHLSVPNFEGNEKKYVNEALDQGWVSTGGAFIKKFEEDLSNYLNVKDVCCCQSGTSALHLSLIEAGVTRDDIVIVPTLTFIAAVNPVRYVGAEPVFIDCDDSLCIDPNKLKSFCETECTYDGEVLKYKKNNKIIKAIMVVHVFGNIADMEQIMEIANDYNLKVIEDATEAIGTKYIDGRYKDKFAGTIGDFGAFSFNGNKIITTGGGGAICAHDEKITAHMRFLSTQAKTDPHNYIHDEVGYNYRMTNIQAAIGVAQLEFLPEFIERKHKFYEIYEKEFSDFEYGYLIKFREGTFSNMWFFSLVLDVEKLAQDIFKIIEDLRELGVETRPIWGLIHEQKPYKNYDAYLMEKSLLYSKRVINIPSSTNNKYEDIKSAAQIIKKYILGIVR